MLAKFFTSARRNGEPRCGQVLGLATRVSAANEPRPPACQPEPLLWQAGPVFAKATAGNLRRPTTAKVGAERGTGTPRATARDASERSERAAGAEWGTGSPASAGVRGAGGRSPPVEEDGCMHGWLPILIMIGLGAGFGILNVTIPKLLVRTSRLIFSPASEKMPAADGRPNGLRRRRAARRGRPRASWRGVLHNRRAPGRLPAA